MATLRLGPLLRHVGERDATIWVETDAPASVTVQVAEQEPGERIEHTERTFTVAGHHYALVAVTGLPADSVSRYTVLVDGQTQWPPPAYDRPAPVIRTISPGRAVRVAFGSCHYACAAAVRDDDRFDADALAALAAELRTRPVSDWPDALLLLGDQVYADETSPETQARIAARRDVQTPPGTEVADFEEYSWLYDQSWTDPGVRWLLSTVPSSMIFDDHDVRDDWNISQSWREDMQATPWWQERIVDALASYWVYQHLGNLSPADLAADLTYQAVRATAASGVDATPILRDFAAAADREADGAKGYRWSYRRELGCARLIVVDSRCGRILADGQRAMTGEAEFDWIVEQTAGDYSHLLLATSLPWLLARALHDLEAWNEVLCDGARGTRVARWSETFRQAADLEHWAAFGRSFDALTGLLGDVASRAQAPRSVCVLSGDVHHTYIARAEIGTGTGAPVYQLTCSPLHNYAPAAVKVLFRAFWSRLAETLVCALLAVLHPVPRPRTPVRWRKLAGPWFGNDLMTLRLDPSAADLIVQRAGAERERPRLRTVRRLRLAGSRLPSD